VGGGTGALELCWSAEWGEAQGHLNCVGVQSGERHRGT
jgi:hypothetical protein